MSDLALIDATIDEARVVDDFVRGVLGLAAGELGGQSTKDRSWSQRLFSRPSGPKGIAQSFAISYGPEQLRKAANAADDLLEAVAQLTQARSDVAQAAAIDIGEAGVYDLPSGLRDPEVTAGSPQLDELHRVLSRVLGVLTEARTRVLLAEMRNRRAEAPPNVRTDAPPDAPPHPPS